MLCLADIGAQRGCKIVQMPIDNRVPVSQPEVDGLAIAPWRAPHARHVPVKRRVKGFTDAAGSQVNARVVASAP